MTESDQKRDAAAVRVFPPGVPLVTILLGVGLQRLVPIHAPVGDAGPLIRWAGGAAALAALLGLGLWAVVVMRRSGQEENPWKPSPELLERGPFRVTRNPMYLQMVLVCVAFTAILLNVWVLVLTPLCAWVLHRFAILPEEAYLEGKFGDAYRAYKARVRRWI